MSDGSFLIFFERPIAAFFIVVALILFFLPTLTMLLRRVARGTKPAPESWR